MCTRMQQHGFNLPNTTTTTTKKSRTQNLWLSRLFIIHYGGGAAMWINLSFLSIVKYKPNWYRTHTVVIDYPKDESGISSTGRFEMVFEKDFSWIENGLLPYRFSHESHWWGTFHRVWLLAFLPQISTYLPFSFIFYIIKHFFSVLFISFVCVYRQRHYTRGWLHARMKVLMSN